MMNYWLLNYTICLCVLIILQQDIIPRILHYFCTRSMFVSCYYKYKINMFVLNYPVHNFDDIVTTVTFANKINFIFNFLRIT